VGFFMVRMVQNRLHLPYIVAKHGNNERYGAQHGLSRYDP
jgi:hypothetical protein